MTGTGQRVSVNVYLHSQGATEMPGAGDGGDVAQG